jgi:hypothetical protein
MRKITARINPILGRTLENALTDSDFESCKRKLTPQSVIITEKNILSQLFKSSK